MITVFPFPTENPIRCYEESIVLLYSTQLSTICENGGITGTYYINGVTLSAATEIYEDEDCVCAPTGYYREWDTGANRAVGDIWDHKNRSCTKFKVTCGSSPTPSPTPAPIGPTPSPTPTPVPTSCAAATGLTVQNYYMVDYLYPFILPTPSPSPTPSPTPSPIPAPAPISPRDN